MTERGWILQALRPAGRVNTAFRTLFTLVSAVLGGIFGSVGYTFQGEIVIGYGAFAGYAMAMGIVSGALAALVYLRAMDRVARRLKAGLSVGGDIGLGVCGAQIGALCGLASALLVHIVPALLGMDGGLIIIGTIAGAVVGGIYGLVGSPLAWVVLAERSGRIDEGLAKQESADAENNDAGRA